jgi:hypothetical protein
LELSAETRFRNAWRETWMSRLAASLVLLAGWLCAHPYLGIHHDARLYTLQALSRLYPTSLAGDLFLVHGSQESFTVFSRLYAPLIAFLSAGWAAMLLLIAAHAAWIWGAARLASRLFRDVSDSMLALAGMLVLPAAYSGFSSLYYGEGFLTPRVLVEAAVLHALAFAISGRTKAALAILVLAVPVHPLYAASGLAVVWVILSLRDRRWLLAGLAAAAAGLVLVAVGVPPLDRLRQAFDPNWLAVVRARNALVFPAEWLSYDWSRILFQAALVAGAALWAKAETRRALQAVLAVSVASLLLSLVATEWLKNVLLTQVQMWRNIWLLAVFANAATGYLISTLWREGSRPLALVAVITLGWFWRLFPAVAVVLVILGVALFWWERRRGHTLPGWLDRIAVIAVGLTVSAYIFIEATRVRADPGGRAGVFGFLTAFMSLVGPLQIFAFGLIMIAWLKWRLPSKQALSLALAGCFCVLAFAAWDRRSAWQKWAESPSAQAVPFAAALRQDAQVYWPDGVPESWLILRRPSYFSIDQGAGALFSRAAALAFRDRAASVAALDPRERVAMFAGEKLREGPLPAPSVDSLTTTCRAAPGLDAIITAQSAPGVGSVSWRAPVSREVRRWTGTQWIDEPQQRFFLYLCSAFRQRSSPSPARP